MLGIVQSALVLLASSSSNGGVGAIGYVFLLSGFVFYGYVYFRYRNVTKRHRHETETETTRLNLQQSDERIQSLTGLTNSKMSGANNTAVKGAGGLAFSMDQLSSVTGKLNPLIKQFEKYSGDGGPKT